jgi:selenocysteine lyase/cysteine desulfurase
VTAGSRSVGYDVEALRAREFPWAPRGDSIYLNNASTGPLPMRARAARAEFEALRDEPFRITYELQFGALHRARERCARLIGADAAEIALMVNTSYGINLAARALGLRAGDTVLTFDREFPANIYPWMALPGVRVVRVPCVDTLPDEPALLRALDEPGIRVVTVSWVQFSTGYRVDLERLGRECRARGIRLVVDAIQGVGAHPIDVHAADIDLLACGGQKWMLSPWGTGFVFVRRDLVRALEPMDIGWLSMRNSDDFTTLTDYDLTYRDEASRFEVGTLPAQAFATMAASLDLLLELGVEQVASHIGSLVARLVAWAESREDVRLVTPADASHRAGILSVVPPDAAAAARRLTSARVAFAVREGVIRLSPHCYNTVAEIDRVIEALDG